MTVFRQAQNSGGKFSQWPVQLGLVLTSSFKHLGLLKSSLGIILMVKYQKRTQNHSAKTRQVSKIVQFLLQKADISTYFQPFPFHKWTLSTTALDSTQQTNKSCGYRDMFIVIGYKIVAVLKVKSLLPSTLHSLLF